MLINNEKIPGLALETMRKKFYQFEGIISNKFQITNKELIDSWKNIRKAYNTHVTETNGKYEILMNKEIKAPPVEFCYIQKKFIIGDSENSCS